MHWCAMLHKPGSRKEVLCLLLVESPGGCNLVICGISDLVYSFGCHYYVLLGLHIEFLVPNFQSLRERGGGKKGGIM